MSGVRFFALAALAGIFLPTGATRAAEPEAAVSGPLTQALAESMAQRCLSESRSKGWPAFTIAVVDVERRFDPVTAARRRGSCDG